MLSLKSTYVIATVVIKTFIVLTIIDRVSSETEVQRCTRYITRLLHNENDPLVIFKKAFLFYNKPELEVYHYNLAPQKKTDPVLRIIRSMNKYTIGYFMEILKHVTIEGKDTLQKPYEFCQQYVIGIVQICTNIIIEKLNLNPNWSGSEIFDYLYTVCVKQYINLKYMFLKEHEEMKRNIQQEEPSDEEASEMLTQVKFYEFLFVIIQHYYKQFEDKLEVADVSKMPTPEEFCINKVSESANFKLS